MIELKDGKIASCSYDKTIKLWDLKTNLCILTLKGHEEALWSLIELKDGKIAFCSNDLTIKTNLLVPAYTSTITFPSSANGYWALSWGISEPTFSDTSNQFCITFTGTTEYNPIIYNTNSPYTLITNTGSTTGSANDIINITGSETSLTLNIYQSSTNSLYIGSSKSFNFTVTLTKVP